MHTWCYVWKLCAQREAYSPKCLEGVFSEVGQSSRRGGLFAGIILLVGEA
jgi:hypothetical protein